ncbi:hypothetical protein CYMTET_46269 [Cymbomonas tetramitiformis]|uniref:Uncharacterized protein n=1 Tax=Cymbomonas tetramitiformis TaxID=36881 RepID=A0AAE0BWI0_9CHLO|nr:hypothetical protein CYMTET_46269 [Cymbomonas tetramitiformis]
MPLIPENNENIACVINLSPASKGRVEEKMPVGEDGPSKRLCSQSLKDIINRSSDRTQQKDDREVDPPNRCVERKQTSRRPNGLKETRLRLR